MGARNFKHMKIPVRKLKGKTNFNSQPKYIALYFINIV